MICSTCTSQLQNLDCPVCRAPLAGGYLTSPVRNRISSRIAANSNSAHLATQAFSAIINRYQNDLPEHALNILARAFQDSYSSFLDEHPLISDTDNNRMIRIFRSYLTRRNPHWISDVVNTSNTYDNRTIIDLNRWGREFSTIGSAMLDDPSLRLRDIYPLYFPS